MVHLRVNATESNPNDAINFITALPARTEAETNTARELLRALAAQVKPVMKAHGFVINSFEEYEFNTVFAGRNWNNGETVEIVLRRPDDSFVPMSFLMSTLCHELAHIKHMNHGSDFQALWSQLRLEVEFLQSQGYYGDGFWSSGTRLRDLSEVGGRTAEVGELPEYICGGAQQRARPARRRKRRMGGPSKSSGAQTAKRRKAGSRITTQDAFIGGGRALNDDIADEAQKKAGTGFRKQAGSKKAREERASAIERRLAALQRKAGPSSTVKKEEGMAKREDDEDETESDSDVEVVQETDQERAQTMRGSLGEAELDDLRLTGLAGGLVGPGLALSAERKAALLQSAAAAKEAARVEAESDTEEDSDIEFGGSADDFVAPGKSGTAAVGVSRGTSRAGGSAAGPSSALGAERAHTQLRTAGREPGLKLGQIVQNEVDFRKKEAVGLAGAKSANTLGGRTPSTAPGSTRLKDSDEWECAVCTLQNVSSHLACSACATPKGETSYRAR